MLVRARTRTRPELREMNITRDDPAASGRSRWCEHAAAGLRVVSVEPGAGSGVASERDTLIVRCYNVTREPVSGTIRCGLPVREAYRANLAEDRQEALSLDNGGVTLDVRGGEVVTVEFVPEGASRA